jgi:hypothetical protein
MYGAEGQNRTVDTSLFRAVLCQLSYLGTVAKQEAALLQNDLRKSRDGIVLLQVIYQKRLVWRRGRAFEVGLTEPFALLQRGPAPSCAPHAGESFPRRLIQIPTRPICRGLRVEQALFGGEGGI